VSVRRAAVLGSPIDHSLSPVLHRTAYDVLGLTGWHYGATEVDEHGLAGFLDGCDESWVGLSLTMPLKAAVLSLLDEAAPLVRAVGAANTVLLGGGRRRGENTDVPGMAAALVERGVGRVPHAAVLGGGATGRSAVAALTALTARTTAYIRDSRRAGPLQETAAATGAHLELADWTDAAAALQADLVVNTTVTGAADHLTDAVPDQPGLLLEALYDPWPTPLAAAWSERGGTVVSGLDLLVHQAVLQVGLMTGAAVDVAGLVPLLRAAGEQVLADRTTDRQADRTADQTTGA
jgi:shikimate dehydrogenase